jgi:hypothetical protein
MSAARLQEEAGVLNYGLQRDSLTLVGEESVYLFNFKLGKNRFSKVNIKTHRI